MRSWICAGDIVALDMRSMDKARRATKRTKGPIIGVAIANQSKGMVDVAFECTTIPPMPLDRVLVKRFQVAK